MFPILKKEKLAENIWLMDIGAPRVACSAQPGQFIILRIDERGERIPLTVYDYDPAAGTVTIVVQAVGYSTRKLVALEAGEALADFAGPLGCPAGYVHEGPEQLHGKRFLFVAGGVGAAPVYPQVKWLAQHGVKADVIVGAKNKDTLILLDRMGAVAGNLYAATDDGSYGYHGLVTGLLARLLGREDGGYDEVVAIGPMVMMKSVAQTTREYAVKTTVSLNMLMVDGTGMCGACRVTVGGRTRFTCIEGPEFDGHKVDFDEAIRRQGMYRELETRKERMAAAHRDGKPCRIGLDT